MNKTYFRYIVAASLVLPAISILIPFLPDYQSHELVNCNFSLFTGNYELNVINYIQ